MKISLVVPHMPSPEADNALDRCLESFKGQYDELILVINEGMGFGPAVNYGLRQTTGDYLIVSNNDIELIEGSLRWLPFGDITTVPTTRPTPRDNKPRSIYCIHRRVYETIVERDGFWYDPIFKIGYFEDDDLIKRFGDEWILFHEDVIVSHLNGGGLTMKQMGEQHWFGINQKVFNDKWFPDTCS